MRRLALLAALAVSACATPPPTDETWFWVCPPDGASFTVRYDDAYTAAFVSANGRNYRLLARSAASGARFNDRKVEFWENSRGAQLSGGPDGDLSDCELDED